MAKPLEYNATLVERIDLTDKLAIFRVKPDSTWGPAKDGKIPDFEGGQYVALGLRNEREPEKGSVLRSYSIASPPEEKDHLEFYIRYVDHPASENPLTHLMWGLKNGDRLHLGPRITGHFTLNKTIAPDDKRVKIFVAAGTGLAPFVSIILSHLRRGLDISRFAVLHGAREPCDLGYCAVLKEAFSGQPNRYVPSISRAHLAPEWQGCCGRIETCFDEQNIPLLEKNLGLGEGGLTPERAVVYICGLTGTISSTLTRLLRRGFVPNDRLLRKALGLMDETPSLFFEKYDDEPILDVENPDEVERLLAGTPFANRARGENAEGIDYAAETPTAQT